MSPKPAIAIPARFVDDICSRGVVDYGDVMRLRRTIFAKDALEAADIEALFKIHRATDGYDPAWSILLVEAATGYVVDEMPPQGYVTAENAGWLTACIATDGRIGTACELELLVTIIEKARWVPESLARLALEQVKLAVISGVGPQRAGAELTSGLITVEDVHLLRRILYAFASDGNIAITRSEAEVLFDIEEASAGGPPTPEWQELFVKAIASVVLAASGYEVPTRAEALRQEQWLAGRSVLSIGNFLSRMMQSYQPQTSEERALARLERQRIEIITNEEVTETEATWLAARIGRDGEITANERLLLSFLQRHSRMLHPSLQTLAASVTRAA